MNSMFKKTLAIILATVIISAVLTVLIFRVTGISAFAEIKLQDLLPRAFFLAERTGDYMQGFISKPEFEATFTSDKKIWDSEPYIYNMDGEIIAWSARGDYDVNTALISRYISQVLSGESVSSYTWKNGAGLLVGAPVANVYGTIIGAVFLVKPFNELTSALNGLIWALAIAVLLAIAVMIVPVYVFSRRLTKPLRQMSSAALAMAEGNFNVRAHAEGRDEVAQLGRSLNELSGALSATISALTFERNRLRRVLDGLGEGVIAVNENGGIMQFNPASLRLLGSSEIESSEIYASLSSDTEAVLHGEGTRVVERARRDSVLRFTLTALEAGADGIEGALMLVQDVTEAVRLEQTRRDYVANVSHELRTPLASIRSLSDALCDGLVKKDEDRLRYYGYIQKESMRLSRLIDDLLELSRLQSGAIALTKQRMSVNELIFDVAERYRGIAEDNGYMLRVDVPEDCPDAYSNPDRTEQVLIALLDNAIKHNDGKGEVSLSLEQGEESFTISVSNGGEIAECDIEHIFERFYKADRSHSGEGTGLGLSISKEIMDLLGERIWAESGAGRVTFSFTVSIYKPANIEE